MVNDLFFSKVSQDNPYELKTDSLNKYDTNLICYKEIYQIKPDIDELNGIAIDENDNIVLAGTKLLIYDRNYKLVKSSELNEAGNCVAVNSNSDIYIGIQNHIEVWNIQGTFLGKWKPINSESVLTGIAANESSVFVADATERLVHQYDFKGRFIKNMGMEDSVKGVPSIIIRSPFFDVSIGRDNEIWIVNPGGYLLEAFDEKGNMKSSWGKSSDKIDGFSGCCNPTNIALLFDGSFVTSEKAIVRVKIYSPAGEFMCVVAGPDKFDEGTKGLDLAVDSKNRIYILDPVRKQIRIFEKK
jgi:hypothetical protein